MEKIIKEIEDYKQELKNSSTNVQFKNISEKFINAIIVAEIDKIIELIKQHSDKQQAEKEELINESQNVLKLICEDCSCSVVKCRYGIFKELIQKYMKYSLSEILLNDNEILSHVFLNCIGGYAEKIAGKTRKTQRKQINIELKIDGYDCNPKEFFELLYEQYTDQVKNEATEIVKQQTSEKLYEIEGKITEFNEILTDWANDINWEVDNKLIKE